MFKPNNSIKEAGLMVYLDDSADKHNGKRYADFVDFYSKGVNRANMAYIFGVDPHTMGKWWLIYKDEQGIV